MSLVIITDQTISQATQVLAQNFKPEKVILFGSYARGNFNENSDLDLMVIENTVVEKMAETIKLKKALRFLKIPLDVIVTDASSFNEKKNVPGTVYYWANKEGITLYERTR